MLFNISWKRNQNRKFMRLGPEPANSSRSLDNRVLRNQAFRWLATFIVAIFAIATLKLYQDKGNFSKQAKQALDAVVTILTLLLGLSFFDAYNDLAMVWRWRILEKTKTGYHPATIDLILGLNKWHYVLKLAVSRSNDISLKIRALSLSWIVLMVAGQVSVALINLAYEVNDGLDYTGTYVSTGNVHAANLSCYLELATDATRENCIDLSERPAPAYQATIQSLAHDFGLAIPTYNCTPYEKIQDIWTTTTDAPYFCRRNGTEPEFTYRFLQYNPEDVQMNYPLLTYRTITARSNQCTRHKVTGWIPGPEPATGFPGLNYSYDNVDETSMSYLIIPGIESAYSSTTYIYRDEQLPQKAKQWSCGPRCITMWAYSGVEGKPGDQDYFFQCDITIDAVTSDKPQDELNEDFQISDDMARVAAASIALQGRWTFHPDNKLKEWWTSWQIYFVGNHFDLHRISEDEALRLAGSNMAEFALRSLATMTTRHLASQNLTITVPNEALPMLGSSIQVYWTWVWLLLTCITLVHLVLALSTVYVAYRTEIPKDSKIDIARILRPLLAQDTNTPARNIHRIENTGLLGAQRYAYRPSSSDHSFRYSDIRDQQVSSPNSAARSLISPASRSIPLMDVHRELTSGNNASGRRLSRHETVESLYEREV